MNTNFFKIIAITTALVFSMTASASDWKLAKSKKGVKVYTKEVPGQKIKSFRGTTTIEAELRDIAQLFSADYAYKTWLADIVQSESVKKISFAEQYIYFVQKLPVIKDRDIVIHGVVTQDPDTKALTVKVKEAADMLPESKKYVRMPSLASTFKFTPSGAGTLDVVYEMQVDPGGKIPTALANSFAVKAPYESLLNLKKISTDLARFKNKEFENPFVNAN